MSDECIRCEQSAKFYECVMSDRWKRIKELQAEVNRLNAELAKFKQENLPSQHFPNPED